MTTTTDTPITPVKPGLADQLTTLADHFRANPTFPEIIDITPYRDRVAILLFGRGPTEAPSLVAAAGTLTDTSWTASLHKDIWHVELHGRIGDLRVDVLGQFPQEEATSAAELCDRLARLADVQAVAQ